MDDFSTADPNRSILSDCYVGSEIRDQFDLLD